VKALDGFATFGTTIGTYINSNADVVTVNTQLFREDPVELAGTNWFTTLVRRPGLRGISAEVLE